MNVFWYFGITYYFTSFCDKISLINPNIVVHLIPPETFIILLKVGNCPYFRTKETRDRKLAEARYEYCISIYLYVKIEITFNIFLLFIRNASD